MDPLAVLAGGLATILVATRQSGSLLAGTMEHVVMAQASHCQLVRTYCLELEEATRGNLKEYRIEDEALKKRPEYSHMYISQRASCDERSIHRRRTRMYEKRRGSKRGTMALSSMLDSCLVSVIFQLLAVDIQGKPDSI